MNGQRVSWRRGENNRLTIDLPAGTQGTLRVWYAGKTIWTVMDGVSAASALGLAVYVLTRKKREWA